MKNMWIRIIIIFVLIKALLTGCGGGGDRSGGISSEPSPIVRPDPEQPNFFPPSQTQTAFDDSILPNDGSLIDEQQTLHFLDTFSNYLYHLFQIVLVQILL